MAKYVNGFAIAVSRKNVWAYKKMANWGLTSLPSAED